ncbi:hypothetical protein D3C85_1740150 [compost metagenome]
MAFDEFAVDHPGVAGGQSRRHAEALLDAIHVGFDMVVDLDAVLAQMANPGLAAAAIGIAVDIHADGFRGLAGGGEQGGGEQ